MSTGAFSAGTGFVDLTINDSSFEKAASKIERKLDQMGRRFDRVAAFARNMFLGISGVIGLSLREEAKYSKGMAEIGTLISDQANEYLPRYAAQIDQLATTYGQTTEGLQKGIYEILSATFTADEAFGMIAGSAKAAVGGITSTDVAVDALTSVLNAFNMRGSQTDQVLDKIFMSVFRGKFTFQELARAMGKSATMAYSAGVGFDEYLGMFAALTRAGLRAAPASTRIQALMQGFLAPVAKAKRVAKELGIDLTPAAIQGARLFKTLERLQTLKPEQIREMFTSVLAANAIDILTKNLDAFKEDVKLTADASGMLEAAFQRVAESSFFKWSQMREQLLLLARTIGQALLPVAMAVMKPIMSFVQAFSTFAKESPEVVAGLFSMVSGFSLLFYAVSRLGSIMVKVAQGIILLATNPIMAAILGIAALAAMLYIASQEGDTFSEKLRGVAADLEGPIAGGMEYISILSDFFLSLLEKMAAWSEYLWIAFKAGCLAAIMPFRMVADILSTVFGAAINGILTAWEYLVSRIKGISGYLAGIIQAATNHSGEGIKGLRDAIMAPVQFAPVENRFANGIFGEGNWIDMSLKGIDEAYLGGLSDDFKAAEKKIDDLDGNFERRYQKKADARTAKALKDMKDRWLLRKQAQQGVADALDTGPNVEAQRMAREGLLEVWNRLSIAGQEAVEDPSLEVAKDQLTEQRNANALLQQLVEQSGLIPAVSAEGPAHVDSGELP